MLGAVVAQIDGEMAAHAHEAGLTAETEWEGLMAEGAAYIEMALDPEAGRVRVSFLSTSVNRTRRAIDFI